MKLQVLLADDHALFRDGMRYVLQQLSEQVNVICAGNFAETLKQAENNPGLDLALIDLNMPGSDGVASIRIFHHHFPGVPLVVVSGSEQRSEIEWVMEYGAMGFISKMSSAKEMVVALRVVLGGDIYFPPQLLAQPTAAPITAFKTILPITSAQIAFKERMVLVPYMVRSYDSESKSPNTAPPIAPAAIVVMFAHLFQM